MPGSTTRAVGRLILALFVLLLAAEARAAVYYVRRKGKDNNAGTSPDQAWKTIGKAAETMVAGDTVYVGAGKYSEQVSPGGDGAAGAPVRFVADTGGTMTGDAGDVEISRANAPAIQVAGKNHVHVLGFQITGRQDVVSWSNSAGGLLAACHVRGGNNGVVVGTGCELTALDCTIGDNADYGICVLDSTSNVRLTAARSTITRNGRAGIGFPSGPWNNVTVDVKNCLIWKNYAQGIEIGPGFGGLSVTAWNVTISGNAGCGVEQRGAGLTLANSIVAFNQDRGLFRQSGTMTHSYNLVHGNAGGDYDGTSAATGEISADPLFVNAALDDYHLRDGSPAIDAGAEAAGTVDDDLEGKSRPAGTGWDMGCYESPFSAGGNWRVIEWVEVATPGG